MPLQRVARVCQRQLSYLPKMASVRRLELLSPKFQRPFASQSHCASTCQISCRSVEPLRRYGLFRFFKMAAVRQLLDLLYACLDHPRSVVGGLYHCAKFGRNWHCSFEDMRFSVLCEFGFKMPMHAPFWSVLAQLLG